jgi:hypothetical protein
MASDHFHASTWKQFFLNNAALDYSNTILLKLITVRDPGQSHTSMFFKILKNPGIGLLSLDAMGEQLQLFHNVGTLGGSWIQHKAKLFALFGFGSTSTAIQVSKKVIKEVKSRAPKLSSLLEHIRDSKPIMDAKVPKTLSIIRTSCQSQSVSNAYF